MIHNMQLTEDTNNCSYQIRAYQPGEITISHKASRSDSTPQSSIHNPQSYKVYTKSLILTADTLITDWEPQSLAELMAQHLEKILDLKPEIILLGTGEKFVMPPTALLAPIYERGLSVECMNTGAACRTFIALSSEGRNIAAGLLIK